jgi:hypothetical protein
MIAVLGVAEGGDQGVDPLLMQGLRHERPGERADERAMYEDKEVGH